MLPTITEYDVLFVVRCILRYSNEPVSHHRLSSSALLLLIDSYKYLRNMPAGLQILHKTRLDYPALMLHILPYVAANKASVAPSLPHFWLHWLFPPLPL